MKIQERIQEPNYYTTLSRLPSGTLESEDGLDSCYCVCEYQYLTPDYWITISNTYVILLV